MLSKIASKTPSSQRGNTVCVQSKCRAAWNDHKRNHSTRVKSTSQSKEQNTSAATMEPPPKFIKTFQTLKMGCDLLGAGWRLEVIPYSRTACAAQSNEAAATNTGHFQFTPPASEWPLTPGMTISVWSLLLANQKCCRKDTHSPKRTRILHKLIFLSCFRSHSYMHAHTCLKPFVIGRLTVFTAIDNGGNGNRENNYTLAWLQPSPDESIHLQPCFSLPPSEIFRMQRRAHMLHLQAETMTEHEEHSSAQHCFCLKVPSTPASWKYQANLHFYLILMYSS